MNKITRPLLFSAPGGQTRITQSSRPVTDRLHRRSRAETGFDERTTSRADRYGLPGTARIHDRRGSAPLGRGACGGDLELGQRSLVLWQLTKIRFANRATAIRPTITIVCRV